jgi:hypothetical protein
VALDVEAEDRLRGFFGIRRRLRDLDAAGLAAAAGLHLRLDDGDATELLGCRAHLRRGLGDDAGEHGNTVLFEQITGLVLVQIHAGLLLPLRGADAWWQGRLLSTSR